MAMGSKNGSHIQKNLNNSLERLEKYCSKIVHEEIIRELKNFFYDVRP
jgi:hypothetical protein